MPELTALELLCRVKERYTRAEIANHIGKTVRTLRRWEQKNIPCPQLLLPALREMLAKPVAVAQKSLSPFTFIDLFAGIGGMRLGFEQAGGKCVFTSEWNSYSRKTYLKNHPQTEEVAGDITLVAADDIPEHDVLLAGFPCQPFSIAGVSKKNALGKLHGFECVTQGTLFFDVARIIAQRRPKAFLLENVKNLVSHDTGNTFRIILATLGEELGYHISWKIIDARYFVPQHRERILIAGFAERTAFSWDEVEIPANRPVLSSVLHRTDGTEPCLEGDNNKYFDITNSRVRSRYTLTGRMWDYLQAYAEKHRKAGNGFGYGLFGPDDVARTLSARYYKDGSEILIRQEGGRPRRLTPRECARLMGFSDTFQIPVSDTQAYRQFGNSIVVPMVAAVAKAMVPYIASPHDRQKRAEGEHG